MERIGLASNSVSGTFGAAMAAVQIRGFLVKENQNLSGGGS
jgi:hypothetical protein